MKKCSSCGLTKEKSEFFFKNKEKNILQSICKECKREVDRKSYSENRNNRKLKIRQGAKRTKNKVREFYFEYKKNCECSVCGEKRWYVLDFHHLENKTDGISEIVSQGSSLRKLKEELKKCIPVCSNCHREIHYKESIL